LPALGALLVGVIVAFSIIADAGRVSVVSENNASVVGRVLMPRLYGVDKQNRPFVVTAASAETEPGRNAATPDLLLHDINAGFKLGSQDPLALVATHGTYNGDAGEIDLGGKVAVRNGQGTTLEGVSAVVDVDGRTAVSTDPVTATTKTRRLDAAGVEILDGGNRVVFKGKTSVSPLSVQVPH
jgi:lipopolysaccharide export system protein LptC